jgi:hypothetical protein
MTASFDFLPYSITFNIETDLHSVCPKDLPVLLRQAERGRHGDVQLSEGRHKP